MCTVIESRESPNESDHVALMDDAECNEQRDKMREDIFDDTYLGRLPVNEVLLSFSVFSIPMKHHLSILSWGGMGGNRAWQIATCLRVLLSFSGDGSAGTDVMLQS